MNLCHKDKYMTIIDFSGHSVDHVGGNLKYPNFLKDTTDMLSSFGLSTLETGLNQQHLRADGKTRFGVWHTCSSYVDKCSFWKTELLNCGFYKCDYWKFVNPWFLHYTLHSSNFPESFKSIPQIFCYTTKSKFCNNFIFCENGGGEMVFALKLSW